MTAAATRKKPTQSNQSAEKLLVIMEALSTLTEPVRLQELAALLAMNASTVLRFLAPLIDRGYVVQDPETSRYRLTFKLCGIANNISSRADIRKVAFPYLRSVAHIFQESANLTVERDMAATYIEVVNFPGKALTMMQHIGHVAPLHCTGVGKLFLSGYSPQKFERYVKVKGLPRFTSQTITEPDALLRAVEKAREVGYAFDDGECEEGARCIAAPIRDYTGAIIACISVSGPSTRMTDEHIYENLGHLLDAAGQISFRLGFTLS